MRRISRRLDLTIVWREGRRASTMDLHVVSDGALGAGRRPLGDIGAWLGGYVFRAELVLSFGRDVAATVRQSVLWRRSRSGAARIHVPPMSDTWLRIYETDYDKRRAEL
jgi:hypothetical protein